MMSPSKVLLLVHEALGIEIIRIDQAGKQDADKMMAVVRIYGLGWQQVFFRKAKYRTLDSAGDFFFHLCIKVGTIGQATVVRCYRERQQRKQFRIQLFSQKCSYVGMGCFMNILQTVSIPGKLSDISLKGVLFFAFVVKSADDIPHVPASKSRSELLCQQSNPFLMFFIGLKNPGFGILCIHLLEVRNDFRFFHRYSILTFRIMSSFQEIFHPYPTIAPKHRHETYPDYLFRPDPLKAIRLSAFQMHTHCTSPRS